MNSPFPTKLKLRSTILCDEVYTTESGRVITGVKEGQIDFTASPTLFEGNVFACFDVPPGVHVIDVEVKAPRFSGRGSVSANGGENGSYVEVECPTYAFVTEDSMIRFRWKIENGRWSAPVTWHLKIEPDAYILSKEERDNALLAYTSTLKLERTMRYAASQSSAE